MNKLGKILDLLYARLDANSFWATSVKSVDSEKWLPRSLASRSRPKYLICFPIYICMCVRMLRSVLFSLARYPNDNECLVFHICIGIIDRAECVF